MSIQQRRTLQQTLTSLPPAEVLAAATRFFSTRNGIYAAYPEKEGPTFVNLRGQGGEEVVIAAVVGEGGTHVTGSSYIFDQQISRFFATLPPFPTEDVETGPDDVGTSVDEPMTPDEAPPAGVAATGLATTSGGGSAA
jgi:hypothetical protein